MRAARATPAVIAAVLTMMSAAATAPAEAQVIAKKAALSTAHPLATRAGLAVLQDGGSAADAAVAVAFVLSVVHPQAGTLGGGGFAVYYDSETRGVWTLDFREIAPRALTAEMLQKAKGTDAARALSAGVPSTVSGLAALHARFGAKSWRELLTPAITIAAEGPRDDAEVSAGIATLEKRGIKVAAQLPPRALQATLQRIATGGARAFYNGALAESLVRDVRDAGGVIGFRDLRDYEPQWRAPLQLTFGEYEIHTPPPPSSGGIVIGSALNILSSYDRANIDDPASLHLLVEAQRRAAIDARRYVADPTAARFPLRELLSMERAKLWQRSIEPKQATTTSSLVEPGELTSRGSSTTHFSIVDEQGNVASITTSLGNAFGSGLLLPSLGFFLNEAVLDFGPNPNALAPLKRPASTMTPILVLRGGRPFLAAGTKGGAAAPTTLLQLLLRLSVPGTSLTSAISSPRYHHGGVPDEVQYERARAPEPTIVALNAMGHPVAARDAIGDVHAILFTKSGMAAIADPRRGGSAGGY